MISSPAKEISAQVADPQRSSWIDNTKFILIALVVLGHCMEEWRYKSPVVLAIYQFIYLFHMPAFIYLSGALSRPKFGIEQGTRWLTRLVLPFLVFQAIYLAFDAWLLGKPFVYSVTSPNWILWYLMSLACWRIMLIPALSFTRPLLVACTLAVLSGYLNDVGYSFSLSRTLVFFPFFVAGYLHGTKIKGPRLAAVGVLLALAGFAWLIRELSAKWLFGLAPYTNLWGGAIQAGLLAASAAGVWAVLRLTPRAASPFEKMGRESLSVYLLHGLLIKLATAYGIWKLFRHLGVGQSLGVVIGATLLLVTLLAAVAPLFHPIMNYQWLFRSRPAPAADKVTGAS
ncbi:MULTISPECIES: acyltransferase family protein [Rhodanobacter]|uniref:Acyltransferase 3 n=2 Tax=Rhodanobacter TaxID=75309 RepID=I4VR14_9GAMM|nr:acyltransferase family protein [Rhodanobacter spathiphylli]EIL89655.1 acyltransferase 3 [Rhodanobacter spathiphylli B39]